jgi:hypothetical protein
MYTYMCLGSWDNDTRTQKKNDCIVKFLIDMYMNTYVYIKIDINICIHTCIWGILG